MDNLFASLPDPAATEEHFTSLFNAAGIQIERIVSHGHASPAGFWYDQPHTEWVVLLQGSAGLRIADEPNPRTLRPGDFLAIPAHRRHRVEFTTPDQPTVWLAVHLPPDSTPPS